MFCTNCGKNFEGNFCPDCGAASSNATATLVVEKSPEPTKADSSKNSAQFTLIGERWTIRSFSKIVTTISVESSGMITGETNYGHIIGKKIAKFSFHIQDVAAIGFCNFFRVYFSDILRFAVAIAIAVGVDPLYGVLLLGAFVSLCFFQAIKITLTDGRIIKIPAFTKVSAREFIDYIQKERG